MASSVKENDDLAQDDAEFTLVKNQFEEFLDSTLTARGLAEKCRAYRDGDQWTEAEVNTLKKRKQPVITDNKIQDKCDTLLGIEKQMRTDPKAFPRNPQDEGAAEAATDALRYVADSSDFNRTVRKSAADNLMVEGLCYGQVVVEPKKYGPAKVCMEHIRWDRGFYDIHSLRDDFSDKRYGGFFTWMDYEEAKSTFDPKKNKRAAKEALENLEAAITTSSSDSTAGPDGSLDDKPKYVVSNRGRKRVQVFEHYYLYEDVWKLAKWCSGGWLEAPTKSPWLDENGEPECGIEIQALYRKGEDASPYGSVQRFLDMQDAHNKRHSKMLHLLNAKRLVAPKGAFENIKDAREQIHRPDGYLEYNPMGPGNEVRVEDNLKEADSQFQVLVYTDQLLSQAGPNAALSGQGGQNLSGRAKQLDQQSGSLPISPLFDALDAWELRMFRQAWNRVRQFWNKETWIRVTDDEEKLKFIGLNEPMTLAHLGAEQLKNDQSIPPEQKRQMVMQMAQDPRLQQPALDAKGKQRIKNEVARMDIDIIIDRAMDTVNVQQEQFERLMALAERRPEVPFELMIEISQLRSDVKKRALDKITGANNPQAQKMAQLQEKLAELEGALKEANILKTQAAAQKDLQAARETEIDILVKSDQLINQPVTPKTQVSVN